MIIVTGSHKTYRQVVASSTSSGRREKKIYVRRPKELKR